MDAVASMTMVFADARFDLYGILPRHSESSESEEKINT
jgi:hypothetical protein